jgi:hypothetical protein
MGISPMKEVGFRMGTVFAIAGVGALTAPPTGGAIFAATLGGVYNYACVFSEVNYFICILCLVWLRARLTGSWKLFQNI